MSEPCPKCPFRTDIKPFLRRDRAREIAASLRQGGMFPCHQTVDYSNDDDGRVTADSKWCGGAVATMLKEGIAEQNQMVRISYRLGMLDLENADSDLVPKSLAAWVRRQAP